MKKFLDCISIVGATPSKFHGTKKYVSTGAVATTEIDESEVVEVTYEDRPSRANLSADAGDILFAKMQGTRKTLLLDSETEKNIYSTGFYAVRANPEVITTECLYYLIDSELFLAQKDKNCSGATQKAITNGGMAKIEISVPALSEQGILVDKLKHLTQLIADKKKQLNLFDEIIKSRFIEMFGDPVTNLKGWTTKPLLDMGNCKNGMNFHTGDSGMEMHCLGVGDFKDLSFIDGTDHLPVISLNEAPPEESMLRDGDIVFVRSNGNKALVGRCLVVYPRSTPTTYSGFCIRYRLTSSEVDTTYLLRVLKTDSMRKKMTGRGANIQNLNQQILAALDIPLPPIKLQQAFAVFVEQVDKSKFEIQQSLEKLEILKKSLMQQYFG